jgi:putative ABC transport system permease protein
VTGIVLTIGVLVVWQRMSGMTVLGNLTTGAVALAAWMIASPTVRKGRIVITPLWESMFGRVGWFAGEYLGQHARGASLSVATLGLGLGIVLMFGMLGWSLERTVVAQLAGRFRADFVVMSPLVSEGWMASPVTDQVVDEIRAVPGVAAVAGQQTRDVPFGDDRVSLFSHDSLCFLDEHVCKWPVAPGAVTGALGAVARGDGALVSATVARRHHIAPGDHIELASPTGIQRFIVAAIPREEPANAIIIARERYRSAWADEQVRWTHVRVDPHGDRDAVERAIRRQVGEKYRLDVRSTAAFVNYLGSQVRRAFTLLYLMEGIIFVLILIGIGDSLATAVIERTREFGMMRAVGLRRSRLFAIVVLEGMALGVLGLALATVTGIGLGLFWVKVQFPAILGWNLDLHVPVRFTVTAAVLTLLLCLVASIIPAIRAAWLPVPAALREE